MRFLNRCIAVFCVGLALQAIPAAYAQLVELPGVDAERIKRLNNMFKELTSCRPNQSGQLVPALLDSLSGINQSAMYQVYQQLRPAMEDPSVLEALIQELKSSHAETASALLANCRNYGANMDFSVAQIQEMLAALSSENAIVRRNLAQALISVSLPNDTTVQDALIRLLQTDPQSTVRSQAANSLAHMGREVYFKHAANIAGAFGKALTEDISPQVRSAAASGLAQMGAKAAPAAHLLSKALTDNSSQVRYQVIQSIINIGPPCSECLDELIDMFNGPADSYGGTSKERIMQAFVAMGPAATKALPLIIPMLKERSTASNAARALGNMGATAAPAVPALIKLLDSPYYNERESAARALGSIGPPAKSAVPALRKACNDERNAEGSGDTARARQTAKESILRITGAAE